MRQFNVYGRDGAMDLQHLGTVSAADARDALAAWEEMYGGNYGAVVVLPVASARKSRAFVEA